MLFMISDSSTEMGMCDILTFYRENSAKEGGGAME